MAKKTLAEAKKGDKVIVKGFTGIKLVVTEIAAATEKTVTVIKKDGSKMVFSRKTGKQTNVEEGKEKYANSVMMDDGSFVAPSKSGKKSKKDDKKAAEKPAKKSKKDETPEEDEEDEAEDEEDEEEEEKPAKKADKKSSKKSAKKSKKDESDDEDYEEIE